MTEEKPKEEAKSPEGKEEAKKPEKTPKDDTPKKTPEKIVRPKECTSCGKNIDKQWYYREGGYYCTKKCWKKTKEKARADKEKVDKAEKGTK